MNEEMKKQRVALEQEGLRLEKSFTRVAILRLLVFFVAAGALFVGIKSHSILGLLVVETEDFKLVLLGGFDGIGKTGFAAVGNVVIGDTERVDAEGFEGLSGGRGGSVREAVCVGGSTVSEGRFKVSNDVVARIEKVGNLGVE